MTNVQKNLSKATTALARCADDLAKININKERLTSLTDAIIFLGHTHKSVTNLRRDLMRYMLPPDFKTLCDTTTEASNTLLYGDDIKLCETTTEASHTLLYGDDIKLCETTTEASHTLLYGDDIKLCETTTEASQTLLYGK